MSLADLQQVGALLPTYPMWVRALMLGVLVAWTVSYVLLTFLAPPASLTLVRFAQIKVTGEPSSLAFEVLLNNRTGEVATIGTARLQFYEGEPPEGGLSANEAVSAVYAVAPVGNELAVDDGGALSQQVTLNQPYAGQSYQEMHIPLSQTVEDKKGDRFAIVLRTPELVDHRNDTVRLTLTYNDGATVQKEAALQLPDIR